MLDIKHSKTIRNGLSLNNLVGVFPVDGDPSTQDAGVPKGSLALDYTGGKLWQKKRSLASSWAVILGGGTGEYHVFKHTAPSGEDGGTSRKETWNVRALSIVETSAENPATIAGDDFIIPVGAYFVSAEAASHDAGCGVLRIWDESTDSSALSGAPSDDKSGGKVSLMGILHSDGASKFELQHYTDKRQDASGLGKAIGRGDAEVYATVTLIKVGP